jgi:hypothetical protein
MPVEELADSARPREVVDAIPPVDQGQIGRERRHARGIVLDARGA